MCLSFLREVKLCVTRRSESTSEARLARRNRRREAEKQAAASETSDQCTADHNSRSKPGFSLAKKTVQSVSSSVGPDVKSDSCRVRRRQSADVKCKESQKPVVARVKAATGVKSSKGLAPSSSTAKTAITSAASSPSPKTPAVCPRTTASQQPSKSQTKKAATPTSLPPPSPFAADDDCDPQQNDSNASWTASSTVASNVSSTPETVSTDLTDYEDDDTEIGSVTKALRTRRPPVNDRADPPKPKTSTQQDDKANRPKRTHRSRSPRLQTKPAEPRDRPVRRRTHMLPTGNRRGVAAVFTGLLYFKQKAFIYPSHMPQNARTDVPRPSNFGIKDFEDLVIPTEDGEKLSAFYIRAPKGARNPGYTVVMFHGNAGNIGHRLPIARMLINYVGCNVFMLEYRGYGLSTGEPDEAGLNVDAQTALDYLRDRHETSTHRYLIYGQSLGGAVTVRLVAQNQSRGDIAGMILENTFLSMRKLIPSVIPMAKYISILCHQVWPSDTLIPSIKVPILFLSGEQDEIVPPSHMRKLHELATAEKLVWKSFPGGDHNSSVLEEGYFETITTFVNEISDDLPIQGTDEVEKRN